MYSLEAGRLDAWVLSNCEYINGPAQAIGALAHVPRSHYRVAVAERLARTEIYRPGTSAPGLNDEHEHGIRIPQHVLRMYSANPKERGCHLRLVSIPRHLGSGASHT